MIYFLMILGGLAFGWKAAFYGFLFFIALDVLFNVILPGWDRSRNRRRNTRLRQERERARVARLAARYDAGKDPSV